MISFSLLASPFTLVHLSLSLSPSLSPFSLQGLITAAVRKITYPCVYLYKKRRQRRQDQENPDETEKPVKVDIHVSVHVNKSTDWKISSPSTCKLLWRIHVQ